MQIDPAVEGDSKMMFELYQLFFSWATPDEIQAANIPKEEADELDEEEKLAKAEERKKK